MIHRYIYIYPCHTIDVLLPLARVQDQIHVSLAQHDHHARSDTCKIARHKQSSVDRFHSLPCLKTSGWVTMKTFAALEGFHAACPRPPHWGRRSSPPPWPLPLGGSSIDAPLVAAAPLGVLSKPLPRPPAPACPPSLLKA